MEIKKMQEQIKKFIDDRKWGETYQLYGVLLNVVEEVGEIWNVIKHLEKEEEKLKQVIRQSREELEDGIGDLLFLVLKLASILDIDAQEAVKNRLREFADRFPAEFMQKHTFAGNRRAGGIDLKYQKDSP